MYFGDDDENASDSTSNDDSSQVAAVSDNGSDPVDLSDKQGVVDPADLKQDDPPEPSLHVEEPPVPTPPNDSEFRVDVSGSTVVTPDLQSAPDSSPASSSEGDSGGEDGGNSSGGSDDN